MTVQFPDPNVTTTYTNPSTGEVYNWNPISGGWRRAQDSAGGSLPDPSDPDKQPGTLDDRYVNLNGDTMTGALVQHTDSGTAPGGTGNLATNTPSDTSLEFRYQGSDDTVRCVTLPLGCCQTVTQRTHIQIQGGGSGSAEVGDVLEITQNGEIDPFADIDSTQWVIESEAGNFDFVDIAGETGTAYTVDAADLGKRIGVKQTFLAGQECEKVIRSNLLGIVEGGAPVANYFGFSFSTGTLKMYVTLNADSVLYKQDGDAWAEETTISSGVNRQFQTNSAGSYIIESDTITALRFENSSATAIGLTIDERSYTNNVTNTYRMFYRHSDFSQDFDWWDTVNVTDMGGMFGYTAFNGNVDGWNVSNVTDMNNMFAGCDTFDRDISSWNVGKVENMGLMFQGCKRFNQNIRNWDVKNLKNANSMFKLADDFNIDISIWNMSNVEVITTMFYGTVSFNQPVGSWDMPKVTSFQQVFSHTKSFDQNLDSWNTSNVTNMARVFEGAEMFDSGVENWDTSNVTNMLVMFGNSKKFNRDISGWDTSKVKNMASMFANAGAFNRDISPWCVPLIDEKPYNFDFDTPAGFANTPERQPQWGTCPPKILTNPVIQ